MRYLIIASLLAAALGFGCPTARAAEIYFDPSSYTSLAAAGSKDSIAPGTQITLRNWQSYKRFLPFGLQALYSGRYLWHVGSGPEYTLTVGTASHISLTRQFVLDTEKYSSQSHLEKAASGGFTLRGYIAGLPFPNPGEPEKAAKILLNARNVYYCALWKSSNRSFLIDRFLNATPFKNIGVTWRLAHLSFPGKPANPPYGRNYLQSARYEIKAPVQQKYLTVIFLQPEDPAAFAESWVFVPWLRRSLRLATRDGCAPNFGDTLFDDQGNFFLVPLANFKISFLGEHKILHLTHANTRRPGYRTRAVTLVTTLLDPKAHPAAELARLYGLRWGVETDLRHLKQTMKMDVLHCETVAGVEKELAVFALVYNLVRRVMEEAGRRQGVEPNRVSFVDALRWLQEARPGDELARLVVNPDRPGRVQPRVRKRRPKQYPLMTRPRAELRKALLKQRPAA